MVFMSLLRDWQVIQSLQNSRISSFKAVSWVCFFEIAFVVGQLNIESLFRLIGLVISLVRLIIVSETKALN